MPSRSTEQPTLPPAVESAILDAIKSLEYGCVEVTVHDSRVVQIECTRKIRFTHSNGTTTEPVQKP
jgi:hypothetical protein